MLTLANTAKETIPKVEFKIKPSFQYNCYTNVFWQKNIKLVNTVVAEDINHQDIFQLYLRADL